MKKFFLVALAVVGTSLSMSSCKKDYTCSCTVGSMETKAEITNSSKKDAEDACAKLHTSAATSGGKCELK